MNSPFAAFFHHLTFGIGETIGYQSHPTKYGNVVTYWKNGVLTPLSDLSAVSAVAEFVVVSGSDVYVAGYSAPTLYTTGSSPYIAQYWKNGTAIPLTDGINGAKAFGIAVVGGSVYSAGFTSAGAGVMATIWRDGSPARLTVGNYNAVVLALAVLSKRILSTEIVLGEYAVGYDGSTAKVWVNGVSQAWH